MGGKRPGAGRPRNTGGYDEAKDLIKLNNKAITQRAITLALHKKEPNVSLLCKLLDKVLPNLNLGDLTVDANLTRGLKEIPEKTIKKMIKEFATYDINDKKTKK